MPCAVVVRVKYNLVVVGEVLIAMATAVAEAAAAVASLVLLALFRADLRHASIPDGHMGPAGGFYY